MRRYTVYLFIVNLLVIMLLIWIGHQRQDDFRNYHQAIAQESTASAARAVHGFIQERKRLVSLFAKEHTGLIAALLQQPHDDEHKLRVEQAIKTYFPDYFSFTVTDTRGIELIDNFEGYVGDLCLDDLKQFTRHGTQSPRIHPNHAVYHFDILAPLKQTASGGILLISFHSDILGTILKRAQSKGHQMMLIDPGQNLIEVTAEGARIKLDRLDYRLSVKERERILSSEAVDETVWEVIDLHLPDLFIAYQGKLLLHSLMFFGLFLIISLLMYVALRRQEALRIRAEQNKEEFLGLASHELRTPITAIHGSLALVKSGHMGQVNDEIGECISIAMKNSQRMSRLIDDLLDLQKIEAGRMEFDLQRINLREIVSSCIENNQGYCEQFGASIVLHDFDGEIHVNVDPTRFEQALANLLTNAVKYGAREDRIDVAIDRRDGYVRISVTDHGQGIPSSRQHLIFKRFMQLGKASTGPVKGTGLGLSIVENLIEQQGGRVGFDSQEGQGSTFYIELPLA